jgi:hypothetical protein
MVILSLYAPELLPSSDAVDLTAPALLLMIIIARSASNSNKNEDLDQNIIAKYLHDAMQCCIQTQTPEFCHFVFLGRGKNLSKY